MTGAVRIRPARPADAAAASRVAAAAKAHWGDPAEWLRAWEAELTVTAEYLALHPAWCAEAGPVVGFCALEESEEAWEVGHLWVLPAWHGRGVGRRLMEAAVRAARETRSGSLLRIVSDPRAAPFYERLGARRAGWHPAPMDGAPGRALPVLVLRL